jgi:hypothetical protein
MNDTVRVASLTEDQAETISKYENDFGQKFGSKIVLIALNQNK